MKITIVAGARPNFIKIAPIIKAIEQAHLDGCNIKFRLVHTGQHYDHQMSTEFFTQLGIPEPNVNFECSFGTPIEQTAAIMVNFEKDLLEHRPDIVLVVGDVNSTIACAITAKKMGIDVAHVEAGIRSGDMSMPEEINRIVTDSITDVYFTTSSFANNNLVNQKIPSEKIKYVGNTMIDTLYQHLDKILPPTFWSSLELSQKKYFLLTLHRPVNVDNPEKLLGLLNAIGKSAEGYTVVFPVHPRTNKILQSLKLNIDNLYFVPPQGYHEFIYLIKNAKGVITDSGGITEEATVLGVPCITMRNTTERPETVFFGTNELVGDDIEKLDIYMQNIIEGIWKKTQIPKYWDGKASERIVSDLITLYNKKPSVEKVY
jgi:UDP-N-acetylglucosamine 2-epimerase (non-hydrolysing)